MSREIPESERLEAMRLYFMGYSYDDIAKKVGIGKATGFAVIEELKSGKYPQYGLVEELIADMRDVAVGLRKMDISSAEGINLFILLKRLMGLGVEPSHLDAWVKMCRLVPEDAGLTRSHILEAAMKLAGLEADQGMSFEDVIGKYSSSAAALKELEEKLQDSRTELSKLEDNRQTLNQVCQGLESEKRRLESENGELTRKAQELSARCGELEKTAGNLQASVSSLEEKAKSLSEKIPHMEEEFATLEQEVTERTGVLKGLESLGFSGMVLDQLHTKLAEMAGRYGKEDLPARFFQNVDNYDSCLGLEATREALTREVHTLTKQKDSLTGFAEKLNMTPDEVGEGLVALKALQKRGVPPPTIIIWQKMLTDAHTAVQSFQKIVAEYGSIEQTIVARRSQLEGVEKELETKKMALEQMKVQEAGTKVYLTFLKEQTVKEIEGISSSAEALVSKLCQDMRQDIGKWGDVRAEMGKYQDELRLARYFGTIPLSEQAVLNLVRDMDATIVLEYLSITRAWCLAKHNPKRKPPLAITKKYVGIADYVQIELTDIITWALLVLAEGNRQ